MKMSEAFPSKFLAKEDIGTRAVKVVIEEVRMDKVGDDHKAVIYFQGKQKGWAFNKGSGDMIAEHYGDETDNWGGVEIELYVDPNIEFKGKRRGGIRCRLALPPAAEEGGGSEIPF